MKLTATMAAALVMIGTLACAPPDDGVTGPPTTTVPPASGTPLRFVRRLTADELAASLQVTTGVAWTDYASHAATLGRPDQLHTLVEGEQISLAFMRFAEDGARATCHSAVRAERNLTDPAMRPVLGAVVLATPDPAVRTANLRRLLLRFHGTDVTSDADPRLAPYQNILDTTLGGHAAAADVELARWETVCVALATHLDFLTY